MAEFDFDELDRSITEAMSKSGLIKDNSQSQPAADPTQPVSSKPIDTEPAADEPNKLAPGPGPVASVALPSIHPLQPPQTAATPASAPAPAPAPSTVNTPETISSTPAISSDLPSPAPVAVAQTVADQGGLAPAQTGSQIPVKIKHRGHFMDMVHPSSDMSKPVNKASRGVSTPPASNAPVVDSIMPAARRAAQSNPEDQPGVRTEQVQSNGLGYSGVAGEVSNGVAIPQQSASDAVSPSSTQPSSQSSVFAPASSGSENLSKESKGTDDNSDDGKSKSYAIGGTHGRDIAPSAELVESLQRNAQEASNEVGFSQAESRANDIQSIEEASAENDEDDTRTQDTPAVIKKRKMAPITSTDKSKNSEPAPAKLESVAETKGHVIDTESAVGQPTEAKSELPANGADRPASQQQVEADADTEEEVAAEAAPVHEQTIDEIESGAIYDTSEYYTEVKDDKSRKKSRHSGLKWFLIIIVFLALGALAGAGYFFLTRY
ncbi:MAG: hypothetical protein LP071_01005 [Candidatus Nanogingivalaceae bacterium]|jgi:hypothetical protein|nr:hypothetical protein [Candidatus Nanogingivalaceae bacterium]